MGLKGEATIELVDVKTGKRETIAKHNIVTNAVPQILSNAFGWQTWTSYDSDYLAYEMFPILTKLFGGILLFEDNIEENTETIFAPNSKKLIGYASIAGVNDTKDPMRGSINKIESGAVNGGYKFVYDFATSQANGMIGCVCLTSYWGGVAGYGSVYEGGNYRSPLIHCNNYSEYDGDIIPLSTMLHYDDKADIITSAYVSAQNTITVTRLKAPIKNWNLLKLPTFNTLWLIETVEIETLTTEKFASSFDKNGVRYCNLCEASDGYIWGFEHDGGASQNTEGKAKVNWIKISVDDLSFEEGQMEIDAQLKDFGSIYLNGKKSGMISSSAVTEGNLFVFDQKNRLCKINLKNPTKIEFFGPVSGGNKGPFTTSDYPRSLLAVRCGRVVFNGGYFNGDTIVNTKELGNYTFSKYGMSLTTAPLDLAYCPNGVNIGPLFLSNIPYRYVIGNLSGSYYSNITALMLESPYLATINNIPSPVEKTADKTMKITYILTENVPTEDQQNDPATQILEPIDEPVQEQTPDEPQAQEPSLEENQIEKSEAVNTDIS